jgi:hypothetical protein
VIGKKTSAGTQNNRKGSKKTEAAATTTERFCVKKVQAGTSIRFHQPSTNTERTKTSRKVPRTESRKGWRG